MKSRIVLKNLLDGKEFDSVLVDVKDAADTEPVRKKIIELLSNDEAWQCFGIDADTIEVEFQYPEDV